MILFLRDNDAKYLAIVKVMKYESNHLKSKMNSFGFQILTIPTVVNGDTAFLTICLAKRVLDNLKELLKMELADNVAVKIH